MYDSTSSREYGLRLRALALSAVKIRRWPKVVGGRCDVTATVFFLLRHARIMGHDSSCLAQEDRKAGLIAAANKTMPLFDLLTPLR